MSQSDQVVYLNRGSKLFDSKLRQMIEAAKIGRMPPAQWVSYIKGLGSKGVKAADIDESRVLDWLNGEFFDSPPPGRPLEKSELLQALERYSVTVKEVVLGVPQYPSYHHGNQLTPYQEILFIANSEKDNIQDRIDEIEFEMESLGFDLERLAADPELALRLEKERASLMARIVSASGFSWSHFLSNNIQGKHGKNLIAHARVTIHDDLYFIEEIQSDWGQRGRIKKEENAARRARGLPELDWRPEIPKGPFVTDTKLWAGLVLRRLLQRAADLPRIKRVAWIRIDMKNGARVNPVEALQRRQQALDAKYAILVQEAIQNGLEPPPRPTDDHDHFYTKLIPSLAEAVIGKAGGKVRFGSETICGTRYDEIPMFDMTDEVRQVLRGVQPLYSAASVLRFPPPVPEQRLVEIVKDAREMIGSVPHIRFVEKLYNLQDMTSVSGSYINKVINVALNAVDVQQAMRHEAYHFAHEHLLDQRQRGIVLDAFAPGSELNARVRDLLLRDNQAAAARQCVNAEEAAAHGFAYWCAGKLDLREAPAEGVFDTIACAIRDAVRWVGRLIRQHDAHTVEDVFSLLRSGSLAHAHDASRIQEDRDDSDLNFAVYRSMARG